MDADWETISTSVGEGLREGRRAAGLTLRGLAEEIGVSPSLISQVELGKSAPSVATLYRIVSAVGISVDDLFHHPGQNGSAARGRPPESDPAAPRAEWQPPYEGPVLRRGNRLSLTLAGGVRWDRLTAFSEPQIEFLEATYPPGSESCPVEELIVHAGREYGLVLSGTLNATIGSDSYELNPGDSLAFDSSIPHRLWNRGDRAALAAWTVIGRAEDPRLGGA